MSQGSTSLFSFEPGSGRSHRETYAGCMVSLTIPTRSPLNASRFVSSLSLVEKASRVFLAGGGLALVSERLLEIPIVLVGLAWMLLGYSVLVVKSATVQAPARVR